MLYSEENYERQKSEYWWAMDDGGYPAWSSPFQPFKQPLPLEPDMNLCQPGLPTFVYHYTDKSGYDGILRDSRILAGGFFGRPNGTRFGDGVYLTVLEPSSTTAELFVKNYGRFNKQFESSRTKYVFKFWSCNLPGLRFIDNGDQGIILLHPWSFIDLDVCSYWVYKRNVEDNAGLPNDLELIKDAE